MSVQIVPYSVADFNKIPSIVDSDQEFQLGHGEAFVLSTLRLLLFEHKLHDVFCIRLLHKYSELQEDTKLVELNDLMMVWTFEEVDKLPADTVYPISWRVVKGQGLMPYEFKWRGSYEKKAVDLADDKYQAFLKEFVDAVEAAGLCGSVALALRPLKEREKSTYGRRDLEISESTVSTELVCVSKSADTSKQVLKGLTVAWFFTPVTPKD